MNKNAAMAMMSLTALSLFLGSRVPRHKMYFFMKSIIQKNADFDLCPTPTTLPLTPPSTLEVRSA